MSDRDDFKARAKALELDYPSNISTKKLRALVEEAEAAKAANSDNGSTPPEVIGNGDQSGSDQSGATSATGETSSAASGAGTTSAAPASSDDAAGTSDQGTGGSDQDDQDNQTQSAPPAPAIGEPDTWRINCAVPGGRRRGSRRWPGGVTDVAFEDMAEETLEALKADPLFSVNAIALAMQA